ncbi:mitochondral 37S ribosomal protein S27 [Schaereria dolodes]|nr:mitochondral 37S ribosomal protein S27 [Schaereria dolodes]
MEIARSRVLDLMKVQCRIFSTTYNPERIRTGNKILRQRLKGPTLVDYYPRRTATIKDLRKAYPDFETWDDDEEERLDAVELAQTRNKGAPKKKKTAEESKKIAGKKKSSR